MSFSQLSALNLQILKYSFLFFILFANSSSGQNELENAFQNLSFNNPLFLTNSGDGTNRIFVVEQNGIIRVFPNSSTVQTSKTFLDISDRVTSGSETGLLGLAFHPNFENNGYFYVNYTANNPLRTIVSRFQATVNPDSANANSEFQILTFTQPYSNHNGGWIGFGPNDGYLYIASGDGGSSGDPDNYGQRLDALLGKILCIDIDGGTPYLIPTSNPFYDSTNTLVKKEIFAWGLRNPWRCSFDSLTGRFFAADVGQGSWEEIDIIQSGKNYGWRCYEGNHVYDLSGCNYPEYTFPIWEYNHSIGFSITGGYVYRGANVPELQGKYIYGDYITKRIWALDYDGINPPTNQLLLTAPGFITSFGLDEQMELYVTSFDGNIYKFTPTTDCFDVSINAGWNLLSVPLLNDDMSTSNIFPNASSQVFGYDFGYFVVDTLLNGDGYWVKYNNSQLLQICGENFSTPINVNSGWNLIGPFKTQVAIQNISSTPSNIIISPYYGYDAGYITTDTLMPGKGYWVKTSASGILQLNTLFK
ncbi:MAG: PQQ-dependent sugar dehydrogenase [Ignavibacteriales bacterium]